jgi:putative toxin-antitoxin system antitoxin component (TIGR02293 family)
MKKREGKKAPARKKGAREGEVKAYQTEQQEQPMLNEAAVAYGRPNLHVVPKSQPASVLVTNKRPEYMLTSFEKIELIEEGISKTALESLKEKAGLDYDQLSQVLNVARATLINKKGNEKFNIDVSDKILGLASIYSYGYEVFEDKDRFNRWVLRPNRALGGRAPFDILQSTFGREEVKNLIGRIEYGVYS